MAKYVDPTFDISRVCFNPEEFIKCINEVPKFSALVFDEAYGGMSSRAAMSQVNKTLMSVLAEIRQKNLWVFLVLPCFFEMDKYAAVWRSRGLIHVYTGKNFERGRFAFYNQDRKILLYVLGKKFYSYNKPKANFFGSFTAGYTVDEEAYREKKLAALKSYEEEKVDGPLMKERKMFNHFLAFVSAEFKMSQKQIADIVGLDRSSIGKRIRNGQGTEEVH